MTNDSMTNEDLKSFLDEKAAKYNQPAFIETDPIQVPKQFSGKENIEISAFLTATIAWGNRKSIINNANRLMHLMDFQPHDFVMNASETELRKLEHFVHRTFNGEDAIYFVKALRNIYQHYDGLHEVFEKGFAGDDLVKSALINFYQIFFEQQVVRSRKHVSDVARGSAAKRLNMFLRWMVRNDGGRVDFGIWRGIPQSELMLPLDVHTGNVARKLGILQRKSNDWQAVEEISALLKQFDPFDPMKYDYALFGLGAFEKF